MLIKYLLTIVFILFGCSTIFCLDEIPDNPAFLKDTDDNDDSSPAASMSITSRPKVFTILMSQGKNSFNVKVGTKENF